MIRRWLDWTRAHRAIALELFVLSNVAFLAVDIYVAHSVNAFAHSAEWIPFAFSIVGALSLTLALALQKRSPTAASAIRWAIGGGAVLVGVAGLLLHLQSQFFILQSLQSLVYTAPFVAPLAYCGLGLLLILNRMQQAGSERWSAWVVFLALGGFAGNFGLSVCDHAQNGFFEASEWVPVVSSALAVGFLTAALTVKTPTFFKLVLAVLGLQVVVGVLGFGIHAHSAWNGPGGDSFEGFVNGAPIFAPLLFPNLAMLAAFGAWSQQHPPLPEPSPAEGP